MHKKLVSFVKYNKVVLFLYRLFGNCLLMLLRLFVRVKDKRVLFMSFGGQKFDDSPRALFEAMKKDPFFAEYELIWGFTRPEKFSTDGAKKVKVDTFAFYKVALSSRIWITNSSVQRGLRLKRRGIVEINTWHGTPLKKLGDDFTGKITPKKKKHDGTIYASQSEYDREIFTRLFHTEKENILLTDLPRNDALLSYTSEDKKGLKKALSLPLDKKVILYAPTFREYERDKMNACYIKPPIDTAKWKETLSGEYVVLFRAHYEVINILGIQNDGFFFNVSDYPSLNDLMAVSDILLSDYSSIYFDFSITEKPMFAFPYDYKTYLEKRGLYLMLEDVFPYGVFEDEDALLNAFTSFDEETCKAISRTFRERFAPYAGSASEKLLSVLKAALQNK